MKVLAKAQLSLLLSACLAACAADGQSGYVYSDDDLKVRIALSRAKQDVPEYFKALAESDTESSFYARQVFGRGVECVVFENNSSVIIHLDLPIYCFKKGSDELLDML